MANTNGNANGMVDGAVPNMELDLDLVPAAVPDTPPPVELTPGPLPVSEPTPGSYDHPATEFQSWEQVVTALLANHREQIHRFAADKGLAVEEVEKVITVALPWQHFERLCELAVMGARVEAAAVAAQTDANSGS
jgi:hypothetical protein